MFCLTIQGLLASNIWHISVQYTAYHPTFSRHDIPGHSRGDFHFLDVVRHEVFHFTACQKGYFYGVLLWGVSKISWYFKIPHRNTPSFRLAASHELTNFMYRKLRFSPNFFAKTRLRASTILANFFHTYINMDKLKTVLLCTCFVIGLLPSFGQTPDGSPQVIFRFVEGKDMFYVPWNGNDAWALAISAPTTTSMWSSTTCASAPASAARTGGDPSMRASPWYGHYSDRKEEKK